MISPCGLGASSDAATSPNRYETLLSIYRLLAYQAARILGRNLNSHCRASIKLEDSFSVVATNKETERFYTLLAPLEAALR